VDILGDMGVSKLSAKVFFKVNYCFKTVKECFRSNTSIALFYLIFFIKRRMAK